MHHPAHIDGCNLIILRQIHGLLCARFEVLESGWLSYDGETLMLESDRGDQPRVFTEEEQKRILTVSAGNKISECAGYRLFVLHDHA